MIVAVVLGMHRSGTSLVSSILHAMGVRMGENEGHLDRADPDSQPQGYWEDQDFLSLNRQILAKAKCHWHYPVGRKVLLQASWEFLDEMKALVAAKDAKVAEINATMHQFEERQWFGWGWKDPRTSLLLDAWWPLIADKDVRLFWCRRPWDAIADSLIRRGERMARSPDDKQIDAMIRLAELHDRRIENSLARFGLTALPVEFEKLVIKSECREALMAMAWHLGIKDAGLYTRAVCDGQRKVVFRG